MQPERDRLRVFRIYAWGVLIYNVAVILWGAFVRATGSGAGCGEHWPLCNGAALPQSPTLETIIEFTHRTTSTVAGLLVIGLVVFAFRRFPKRHLARRAALASLFFVCMEGLIGAVIVLRGKVAKDFSLEHGYWLCIHLVNTLLMVAAFTIVVWAGGRGAVSWRPGGARWRAAFGAAAAGLLILGASGAIAALGDTLFHSTSFAAGFQQDFASDAHPFVRLRVWHPVIALVVTAGLLALCAWVARQKMDGVGRSAFVVALMIVAQLGVGAINLALLAPIALQIIHLALADALWIAFVMLSANALLVEQSSGAGMRAASIEWAHASD